MEEREFAKYAFLIVAVVAVVGLLTMGDGITGFAAKKSVKKPLIPNYAKPATAAPADDAGYPPEAKAKATAQVRGGQRDSCRDNEQGRSNTTGGNLSFFNATDGSTRIFSDYCWQPRGSGYLTEYFCVGSSVRSSEDQCSGGCIGNTLNNGLTYTNAACNSN